MKPMILAAALLGVSAPVLAQVDTPNTAVNAARAAQVNRAEAAAADSELATNEAKQAQYASDMAAYRDTVAAEHRTRAADMRSYHRQQRAYAEAMAAWRLQVAACERGHDRACDAPAPTIADFL